MIKAVVFDVGETLVDETREYGTWADWLGVPRHAFSSVFGAMIALGMDYREAFQYFRPGFSLPDEREKRAEAGQPETFGESDLYSDARPTMAALRDMGVWVGVAGNQTARAGDILRKLDLSADMIATSDDWHAAKPDPVFFHEVIEAAPCAAGQIVYVGAPGVRLLTLDRPDRLNAMSGELIRDLHRALDQVGADEECRVVVLTGAGRGFCAGLDLKERPAHRPGAAQASPQSRMHVQQAIAALVPKLRNLRQPVIAAVNGPASGGGFALALACDIRIAAASAKFNAAFVRIGLSGCDIGVSWLLPRLIGAGRSHELLLTGRLVDAAEADRIGLVNRVVHDGEVLDAALATAAEITANSPMGVWMTKEVAWSQLEIGSLQAGIDLENRTQILTAFTQDHGEQIAAFLDKRPAHYANE